MRIHCKWLCLLVIAATLLTICCVAESACSHDFEEIVLKEATCTEKGIAMSHCLLCGARSYSAIEAVHVFAQEADVTVPATCDEPGGKVWYCVACNSAQDPEANGVYCEVVPAGHKFADEVVYIPANCVEGGRFVHVCTACGEEEMLQEDADNKAFGHDWQYIHEDADCEHAERYSIICSRCDAVRWEMDAVQSQALGHVKPDEVTVISSADCTNSEHISWNCVRCGMCIEEDGESAKGHLLTADVVEEATCQLAGIANYVCEICGVTVEENAVLPVKDCCSPYEIVIAPSTCDENGIMEYRCEWCDNHLSFASIPYGHEAGDVEVTEAATCKETGLGVVHCMVCAEQLKTIVLPAVGHTYSQVPVLRMDECTGESVAVLTCDICGEEEICAQDTYQQTPVHQRAYRYTAPDCECEGVLEVYCAICDEVQLSLSIAEDKALGHCYAEEKVVIAAPDCESAGIAAWVCLRCNDRHDESELPALGHTLEDCIVAEATCYSEGLYNRVCSRCEQVLEADVVIAMKDECESKQEILAAPSCTQDGLCQYVCRWCDRAMGYAIVQSAHTEGELKQVIAPTCRTEGLEQMRCQMCDELMYENVIGCIDHIFDEENPAETLPATCTEPAQLIYHCEMCNADGNNPDGEKRVEAGPCMGHVWADELVIAAADCVTPGRTEKVCTVCADTQVVAYDRNTPALGHQLSYQLQQPTCTEPMLVYGICDVCGYEIECEAAEEIEGINTEALGHVPPEEWFVVVEPTCQQTGLRSKACTVCGEIVKEEVLPLVACSEQLECVLQEANCATGTRQVSLMTCVWCGEIVRVDVQEAVHAFDEEMMVILTAPACEVEGCALQICSECGYEEERVIPALVHEAMEPQAVSADCENCERVMVFCAVCDEVLSVEAQMGEPLGHSYSVFDPVIGKNVCIYCRDVQPE